MILAALATGLVGRLDAPTLVASFNSGYGAALGEFALILIPSFVLAACLSHRSAGSAAGAATVASPFMAAGMICPDTSYAALAPVAGRRKLSVALAGYAGFKLLFPAGPLIYWLVRSDALADRSDGQAIATLAAGATGQAIVGLAVLYALLVFGVV